MSLILTVSLLVTTQGIVASARSVSENTIEEIPYEFVSGNSVSGASVRTEEVRPVLPVHHCQKDTGTQDYTEWDYVYFGSYPQSEVTDAAVIEAVENAIAAYGIRTDGGTDVWVDGVKYRRMSQKHMNDKYAGKTRFADCSYRYFKWERIKWKVLAVNEDSLFVVADKVLDNKSYHDKRESITWKGMGRFIELKQL